MATHSSVLGKNPRDGGDWWAVVYGVPQSRTWLKRLSSSSSSPPKDGTRALPVKVQSPNHQTTKEFPPIILTMVPICPSFVFLSRATIRRQIWSNLKAPHSSTLAWKIPWAEEPGRLQSMGWLGVRHDWATSLSLFTFMHWRRKWQPTPVFLPGESQGRGSLVGYRPWGRPKSETTEAT